MDPNGSTGSSPLTDGDSKNDRQSADDDDQKKSRNAAQAGQNNTSQGARKVPANQGTWRPVGPQAGGLSQGAAGLSIANAPNQQQQQRYPRPQRGPGPTTMQPGGQGGVGLAGHGGQGLGGQGAWPGSGQGSYYPRASRYPQPVSNQSLPAQALGHYQQQQHLGLGGQALGGYRMMPGLQGGHPGAVDQLSKTNLYIRGLPPTTTDRDLYNMCCVFGNINSTKAIIDKMSNQCKGYGFVDFETPQSADRGLKELSGRGMQVQMAKIRTAQEQTQDADPTNLYLANLSPYMVEQDLEAMLQPYGRVVSTRVLRDPNLKSRGVGFARMETREVCEKVIEVLNGKTIAGSQEPLVVKFADSGNRRRMQNRDRNWAGRMDHVGLGGYDQMGGGQNGLAGSMMNSIRYSVPQGGPLGGYQTSWQPQYTILPQQMAQLMPGVEGSGYSVSQLAAQMSQLGLSSAYNQAAYGQYGYNPQQMYQAGMAQMGGNQGGGPTDDGQQQQLNNDGLNGSALGVGGQQQHGGGGQGGQNIGNQGQNMAAVYGAGYQQQK